MKKLTLSMDEKDVRAAHRLARKHHTSVSHMFSRLVRAMTRKSGHAELPALTRKLSGMISLPKHKTDLELIEEALLEKHGLDR